MMNIRELILQGCSSDDYLEGDHSLCSPELLSQVSGQVVGRDLTEEEKSAFYPLLGLLKCVRTTEYAALRGRVATIEEPYFLMKLAVRLVVVFGSLKEALSFFQRATLKTLDEGKSQVLAPLVAFKLPESMAWNQVMWSGFVRRYLPRDKSAVVLSATIIRILPLAANIEAYVSANRNLIEKSIKDAIRAEYVTANGGQEPGHRYVNAVAKPKIDQLFSATTPLTVLLRYAKKVCYRRIGENEVAAGIFFDYALPEQAFELYLSLKPCDDHHQIPNVDIDGARLSEAYAGFYLRKLPSADPRAPILGKLSSCCQSLNDAGEEAVIYGITRPHGGFYVLWNAAEEVLAQCWVWRAETGEIVFDSVEMNINAENRYYMMVCDFFTYLAHELVYRHDVPAVNVGVGGKTPEELGTDQVVNIPSVAKDAKYSDAHVQRVMADRSRAHLAIYCERQAKKTKLQPDYYWMHPVTTSQVVSPCLVAPPASLAKVADVSHLMHDRS